MKQKYCLLFIAFNILTATFVSAQQQNISMGGIFSTTYLKKADLHTKHNTVRPFLESHLFDSTEVYDAKQNPYLGKDSTHKNRSWLARKLFFEHFIVVDEKNFYMTIDPMFDFSIGKFNLKGNKEDSSNYSTMNTRGISIKGDIGKHFSFGSSFFENQATFPPFINKYATTHSDLALNQNGEYELLNHYSLIPGEGLSKPFKENGRDYGYAKGYLSYHPTDNLLFQLGTGKNFIGNGYRSLFLSDLAFNYPYFKTQIDFFKHKLRYTIIYAQLQDLYRMPFTTSAEALYYRKAAAFHYLDWEVNDALHIGLFEAGIYQIMDSTGSVPFDLNILEPLPLINSTIYGLNAKNNMMLGLNGQYIFPFKTALYGQVMVDDNQFKHNGYQLGLKFYGMNNLFFQFEYNKTSSFTNDEIYGLNNFTHYNEPLGLLSGDNSSELVFRARWIYQRLFINFKINYIQRGKDSQNILAKNQFIYPNNNSETININFKAGYLINKSYNMSIYTKYVYRKYQSNIQTSLMTNWLQFGLQTNLKHFYSDF